MRTPKGFVQVLLLMGATIIIITIIGTYYSLNKDKSFTNISSTETTPISQLREHFKITPLKRSTPTPQPQPTTKNVQPSNTPTPKQEKPTSTPIPEEKKIPTPTPQPTSTGCIEPTNYPPPPNGGMTYANWYFYKQDISSITTRFKLYNDPGPTSDLYLQLYDGRIDDSPYYFGVQTTHLVIFSRFGTTDLANVRTGPNAYKVQGTSEGPFISLRLNYDLSAETYTTHLQRAEFDGTGDWFNLYMAKDTEEGLGTYIGGIRFPRKNPQTPANLQDGGGTWTEFWDNNNNTTLYPVPFWDIGIFPPTVNDQWPPLGVRTSYSPMPNSDIYFDKTENILHMKLGASTPRCNPARWWAL